MKLDDVIHIMRKELSYIEDDMKIAVEPDKKNFEKGRIYEIKELIDLFEKFRDWWDIIDNVN